jgi:GAF domain-containing protein/HAMP domain-containing protein
MRLPRKALAIVVLTFLGMTAILYALLQIMLRLGLLERDFIGWVFALSALLFGVLTWILLQRFVLRPVTNLSAEVNEISSSQDFSRRLPVRSQDEMGSLSREINHLLELLQKQQVEGDHTQDLQRRITQLRTAAEISRLIGAIQEPQSLLRQVADLMRERFNLYYVGVFLLDERAEYAILKAGTGESGQKMLVSGHKLLVGGDSMIGWATANRQARIALDTGQEAVRFKNPWLPLTRSELALPILSGQEVIGALTIQSVEPEAFDQDDITVLQGIADSLSIALHNARLFTQLQESLYEIQSLHRQYLAQTWSKQPQSQTLDFTFEDPNAPEPKETLQLPVALRDTVIGSLTLDTSDGPLNPEDEAFVAEITTQVALALENARLLEETQRRAEQERIISNLSAKVWSTNDIEAILSTALQELGSALKASEGYIRLEVADE